MAIGRLIALLAALLIALLVAFLLALGLLGGPAFAQVDDPQAVLIDDWGRRLSLPAKRLRIVSLAPHATELLAAAGALEQLIAVDPNSDYPPAVLALPRVASFPVPDFEALALLRPDLVVMWGAGARRETIDRIEALGIAVFISEPRRIADIPATLLRLARVGESPALARQAAQAFTRTIAGLRERHRDSVSVPVFVQVTPRPLMTLSDRDPIGDALQVCGARNVFAGAPAAATTVGLETVLASAPALILALDSGASREPWQGLRLIEPHGTIRLARIDPAIQRPGPRLSNFVTQLCDAVDGVRKRRSLNVSVHTLR